MPLPVTASVRPRLMAGALPWILAGTLLALFARAATAQPSIPEAPATGVLAHPVDVTRPRALQGCSPLSGDFAYDLEAAPASGRLSGTCTVLHVDTLGHADGAIFVAVTHLARQVFAPDSIMRRYEPDRNADTADVVDVVLYAVTGDAGPWRAEWHGWVERAFTWDLTTAMAPLADGALFSFVTCVNGTGGCQQHFLLRRSARWIAPREAYYDQLIDRFGRMFWKGIRVDVRTLRGTVALYAEGDPNCCPSRVLDLALHLDGNALDVATYRVRPSGSRERSPHARGR